jgi:methionyl-tRNA synthetase
VELVTPPEGAAPGDRVSAAGFPGEPEEQLNPKRKQFEQISPDLRTDAQRVACYRGVPLQTPAGPCTVPSIVGGGIK